MWLFAAICADVLGVFSSFFQKGHLLFGGLPCSRWMSVWVAGHRHCALPPLHSGHREAVPERELVPLGRPVPKARGVPRSGGHPGGASKFDLTLSLDFTMPSAYEPGVRKGCLLEDRGAHNPLTWDKKNKPFVTPGRGFTSSIFHIGRLD